MLRVNASFDSSGAGYGFVLRDHKGNALLSGAGPLHGVLSALRAEVLSLWTSFDIEIV